MKQLTSIIAFLTLLAYTVAQATLLSGVPLASNWFTLNDRLYLFGKNANSPFAQLYASDGTAAGTAQLGTVDRGSLVGGGNNILVDNDLSVTAFPSVAFVPMHDYTTNSNLLWQILPATAPIRLASTELYNVAKSTSAVPHFELNGRLYYAKDGLYSFDLNLNDTKIISTNNDIYSITVTSRNATHVIFKGYFGYYSTDGTTVTTLVDTLSNVAIYGSDVFYVAQDANTDYILYKTSGATPIPLTTKTLINCKIGYVGNCFDRNVTKVSDNVYIFIANQQMFVTDGKSAVNTKPLPGALGNTYTEEILTGDGKAIFTCHVNGSTVLYSTDGTTTREIRRSQSLSYDPIAYTKNGIFLYRDNLGLSKTDGKTTTVLHRSARGVIEKSVVVSSGRTYYYLYDVHSVPRGGRIQQLYVTDTFGAAFIQDLKGVKHIFFGNNIVYTEKDNLKIDALPDSVTMAELPVCSGDICETTDAPGIVKSAAACVTLAYALLTVLFFVTL